MGKRDAIHIIIPVKNKSGIVKKSEKMLEHKKQKPRHSKAKLKRDYFNAIINAVEHIKIFNRIDIVPEKKRHLGIIEKELEKCFCHTPCNHILRLEYKYVKEAVLALEENSNIDIKLPELIDEDYYKSVKKKI